MAIPIPLIVGGAATLGGLLGSKQKRLPPVTATQKPMYTPGQESALANLAEFARTGKIGSYTAGETYGGPLGFYGLSGLEKGAQSKMMNMLNAADPRLFSMGESTMIDFLETDKYDPLKSGQYDVIKKQTQKDLEEALTTLGSQAAAGQRYYTGGREKQSRELIENAMLNQQSKLYDLYNTYVGQKLSLIPTALSAGMQKESMDLNKIQTAMQIGDVERLQKNLEAKDAYAEWYRANEDKAKILDTSKVLATYSIPWGTDQVVLSGGYSQPSPWQNVMSTGLDILGTYVGNLGKEKSKSKSEIE